MPHHDRSNAAAGYFSPLAQHLRVDRDTAIVHTLAREGMEYLEDDDPAGAVTRLRGWTRDGETIEIDSYDSGDEEVTTWSEAHLSRVLTILSAHRTRNPIIGNDSIYAAAVVDATEHGVTAPATK